MIPLALVTGFLGSGKTTLLVETARRETARRVVFIVNEFSARDVDGRLLSAVRGETVTIAGGSIFCRCRVTEFIAALTGAPARFGSDDAPLDGMVIEASGIADPRVFATMLAETGLDRVYTPPSITAVVDPSSFLKLIHTLPAVKAQIEAAQTVIVNKVDLRTPDEIVSAEREIARLRPDVAMVRASRCRGAPSLFAPAAGRPAEGADRPVTGKYAPCVDPAFGRTAFRVEGPVDPGALETACAESGSALYRLKGFVPAGAGTLYVDWAAGRFSVRPVEYGTAGIEVIVRGGSLDAVRGTFRSVRGLVEVPDG